MKTELCMNRVQRVTVVCVTVTYQAGYGEGTPKSVKTAKLGRDTEVELTQLILR